MIVKGFGSDGGATVVKATSGVADTGIPIDDKAKIAAAMLGIMVGMYVLVEGGGLVKTVTIDYVFMPAAKFTGYLLASALVVSYVTKKLYIDPELKAYAASKQVSQ